MLRRRRSLRAAPVLALLGAGTLAVAGCGESPPPTATLLAPTLADQSAHVVPGLARDLVELRQLTAPFHNFQKAVDAGWAVPITPCWEHVTQGAMGYHYGNPDLLFDGEVDLLEPEALMYEPGPGGQMRLVGMEYIVFIDDWQGASPPTLLGQVMHPHSFLPIYKLHIWLWRDNPSGIFADWNPKVSCRHADETETFE